MGSTCDALDVDCAKGWPKPISIREQGGVSGGRNKQATIWLLLARAGEIQHRPTDRPTDSTWFTGH